MTFRWEEDLQSSFTASASVNLWWPNGKGHHFQTAESTCSEGRADLVWAAGEVRRKRTLQANARFLNQPTSSRILASLRPHAHRTEKFLVRTCGVSPLTLKRHLQVLTRQGLTREIGTERFTLGSQFYLPKLEICSFEFKLFNWRRALYQATRYRTFSHRVYVVMPPDTVHLAIVHEELFLRFNIGLMVHDNDGYSAKLIECKKRNPTARFRYIMAIGMLFSE